MRHKWLDDHEMSCMVSGRRCIARRTGRYMGIMVRKARIDLFSLFLSIIPCCCCCCC